MFMYGSTICLNLYRGIEQGHDFSLIVYDVFTLNSLSVICALVDYLVLEEGIFYTLLLPLNLL